MFFENRNFVFTIARTRLTHRPSPLLIHCARNKASWNGFGCQKQSNSSCLAVVWLRLVMASSLTGRIVWGIQRTNGTYVSSLRGLLSRSLEYKSQMLAGMRQCAVAARPSIARGGGPVESSDSTVNGSLLTESWCQTSSEKL